MAHHDHNHRNHVRRKFAPRQEALTQFLRERDQLDSDNTPPHTLASVGLWTLTMNADGHLTATYGPTGHQVVVAQAPVAPPPTTVRSYDGTTRAAGSGDASPYLLALVGGLPTSLPPD